MIYIVVKVIKGVMLPVADVECGSLYINTSHAVPFIMSTWEF